MAYMHGIRVLENATSVPTPSENPAGVPIVFGVAPINQLANPAGAVNKPVLCKTFTEAKAAFGYSTNYNAFTLCEAMDAFFKAFRVSPVILVNVADLTNHAAAAAALTTKTVANMKFTLDEKDVVASSLELKKNETVLVKGTDYTYSFDDDGSLNITFISSAVSNGDTITIKGQKMNSTSAKCGATSADIVGTFTANTGASTGLELLRDIYPTFGLFPSLILAPGFTDTTVGVALQEKCDDISGIFRCDCVIDILASTAPTTTALESARAAYTSPHDMLVYPKVVWPGNEDYPMDYSALFAASLCAKDAADADGAPSLKTSNNELPISKAVLASGTEVHIDIELANSFNGVGIVTVLNRSKWVSWGNNTAAYPASTDPKDRWIGVRRFFTWWSNSFIANYFEKVDNPGNPVLIESIVDSENMRGNSFVANGKCAGMRIEFNKEDNDVANLIEGKFTFRQYLAPFTPAEQIIDVLEFDPTMLEEAFSGGEE